MLLMTRILVYLGFVVLRNRGRMSYRFMRVIVFFDLPVTTLEERRLHARFRKFLFKSGFIMMQESVYSKLTLNAVAAKTVIQSVYAASPANGLIQLLTITEKQYNGIEMIIGDKNSEVLDSVERLVVL